MTKQRNTSVKPYTTKTRIIIYTLMLLGLVIITLGYFLFFQQHSSAKYAYSSQPYYNSYNKVNLHYVEPSATSSQIGLPNNPNIYAEPSQNSNGYVVVVLPGTGSYPTNFMDFIKLVASDGFHVIGLEYPDYPSVDSICKNNLICYQQVRQNNLDGAPLPLNLQSVKNVTQNNAIEFRLTSLLTWLVHNDSSGGWSQFISNGISPDYSKYIFAGLSQGGGQAAYEGKVFGLKGVLMLSSIVDSENTVPYTAATWVSQLGATPASQYVGFDDIYDNVHNKVLATWAALGLPQFGTSVSVDGNKSPYAHSHELTTAYQPPTGLGHQLPASDGMGSTVDAHTATGRDTATPLCSDRIPKFAPVWTYMLDTIVQAPSNNVPASC